MKIRAFVAALLTAATLFICTPGFAVAAPALWVVKGPAGKVYLFGTVHILREGTQWRSPELEAAMNESQDLYLEIADADDTAAALKSLVKVAFDRDHPLSTKISEADLALLDAAAKRYGYAGETAFEPMRPWFVSMILLVVPARQSGYSTGNGVDLQIRKEFAAAGKPVEGFETFDAQAHILADLPDAAQAAMLDAELKDLGKQTDTSQLDALVAAWLSGNEDTLEKALQLDANANNAVTARMITDRNETWAAALADRLKRPGTSFVSVGAAHLVGPDGVPALLQKMGFSVTRIAIADVAPSSSPSPAASASAAPSATPSPKPATITPPNGWKARDVTLPTGQMKVERMWIDPKREGVIMTAHLDVEGLSGVDLDTMDTFVHQGLVAAAGSAGGVEPSQRIKICNGKQDALYTKVTVKNVKEDVVLAVSDRGYIAQYVRRKDLPEDAAAVKALLSLCIP